MVCPGCVLGPAIGSSFGSLFNLPKDNKLKAASILLTSALTVLTTLTIKTVFKVSFCGERFTWLRVAAISTGSIVVGVIYSLAICYLLNRAFGSSTKDTKEPTVSATATASSTPTPAKKECAHECKCSKPKTS